MKDSWVRKTGHQFGLFSLEDMAKDDEYALHVKISAGFRVKVFYADKKAFPQAFANYFKANWWTGV